MLNAAYTAEVNRVAELLARQQDVSQALRKCSLTPAEVVKFVVEHYKPPIVWSEEPPNPRSMVPREQFTWTYRASVMIAGKLIRYQSFETAEMRRRGPGAVRFKAHIRHRLGDAIAEFLDGD